MFSDTPYFQTAMSIDFIIPKALPKFPQMLVGIAIHDCVRYFAFAGIAWLLAYVLFKKQWSSRKINVRYPETSDMRREFGWSRVTVACPRFLIHSLREFLVGFGVWVVGWGVRGKVRSLAASVFLPPPVISRRTDFQPLADFLHAPASGQQRRRFTQLLDNLFGRVSFAFHVESSAALARHASLIASGSTFGGAGQRRQARRGRCCA